MSQSPAFANRLQSEFLVRWLPLLAILVGALALRLIFFTGMVRGDDFNYAHAAYDLSLGELNLGGWNGSGRLGLYLPVAVLYRLFDASEVTTLAFPVFASLLSVVCVYGIADHFSGQASGLFAAYLCALLPLDIVLATDLLPDGPTAAFSTGAVFAYLLASQKRGKPAVLFYLLSFAALAWAILIKPVAVITLIFISFHLMWRLFVHKKERILGSKIIQASWFKYSLIALVLAVVLALLFSYLRIERRIFIFAFSRAATDLAKLFITGETDVVFPQLHVTQTNLFWVFTPLFLIAFIYALTRQRNQLGFVLLWLSVAYLYYEWGTINTDITRYEPVEIFTEARSMLFLLAPLIVLAGAYLSQGVPPSITRWLLPVLLWAVVAIAYFLKTDIYSGTLSTYLQTASLAAVFLALISPVFIMNNTGRWKQLITVGYILVLSLATFLPAPVYHPSYVQADREEIELLRLASDYLQEPGLPIYTNVPRKLNYATDFDLGFNWLDRTNVDTDDLILDISVSSPTGIAAYVVFLGNSSSDTSGWMPVAKLESSNYNTTVTVFQISEN
ncbi:MAG: phospholipid carrier-dependent glycosyltransferase [Chloroflexi bacterium]|nr:MAG: phospholipid carrier-dependent glycosyltransferase [Chloroflexota bacterium]MBL1193156.1 phospholipid carrier-dependent glycosyltransferase [Chloroflexota bacterium]NOH10449.1 phospholipid carrier-dependent glycosyltransferase [Chloroflexota bacterium]